MALLYRMGTGNGSGGDLKPYIVQFICDSGYIGQTLTMTYKGTLHAGETVDDVSGTVVLDGTDGKGKLTLYPMHSGNWECSCYSSVTGTTMKKTIELLYWGTTNVEFNDIPDGATVTPTDDVQTWLHCANIWNKSYTTISEVVADTTTLNTLIANENATDYLVRSTTFATDICSNESAMTYIGLNDYCANKLLADSTWLETICNAEEKLLKKVLTIFVPRLTDNTNVEYQSIRSDAPPWKAFDEDDSTLGQGSSGATTSGAYLGYNFNTNCCVKCVRCKNANGATNTMVLEGYDGSNWEPIGEDFNITANDGKVVKVFNHSKSYTKYRLYQKSATAVNSMQFYTIQFYGREEA